MANVIPPRGSSTLLLLVVVVSWCLATGLSKPLVGDNVHNYLMQFGYLPQSDLETGNLRSEDQLKDALRNLQAFANIPATGEMDAATLKLLARPRCGLPDVATSTFRSKRYTLQGQKWHTTNLTWSLRTSARQLERGKVRRELRDALGVWQTHSQLNFTEVDSDNADILIHFFTHYHGDGYAFDGRGTILAHAFFPGTGRGGDAHFDDDEKWLLGEDSGEGTSLFNVAAHEFGHSMGLSHSSVSGSLMYPWYQGSKPAREFTLPQDDQFGIQQLYGSRGKQWEKIPEYKPPPRVTPAPTTRRPQYRPPTRPPYQPGPTQPPYRPHPTEPNRYPEVPRTHPPRPISTTKSPVPTVVPGKPDTCDTEYDAISVIRREIFIFKGKYYWRIGDKGLYKNYPIMTSRFWRGLPTDLTHIDAVYERPDGKIVFFIGNKYWLFDADRMLTGGIPITRLGLPPDLKKLDGAMVWGHNGKTYFFQGTMYWRFDEETQKVELDYPRDMAMWSGVDYNIDAVFQWKDGITYFFKGKSYWKFNDQKMRVESEAPLLSAAFWMGCPTEMEQVPRVVMAENHDPLAVVSSAAPVRASWGLLVLLLLCWTLRPPPPN